MWRRAAAALVLVVFAGAAGFAQQLTGQVIDLIYRVEDLGGRVQPLAVRETSTETRIQLPADILFDFDKSDIRPSAAEALKQTADILRQRAKGTRADIAVLLD